MRAAGRVVALATVGWMAAGAAPAGQRVAVRFTGGHDTDRRDGGRPVALVAAALGVSADVFRDAFSHVRPAGEGRRPTGDEARRNKDALLSRLARFGVTNDRLDEVSNRYRYRPGHGELWTHREATAMAIVRDGRVVGFEVTDGGAGYTTPPTVTIDGRPDVAVVATLSFGADLETNGSVRALAIGPGPTSRPAGGPPGNGKHEGGRHPPVVQPD